MRKNFKLLIWVQKHAFSNVDLISGCKLFKQMKIIQNLGNLTKK